MKAPLKILVIPSWYPPDGGYFFREHCEALAGAGADIEVLVNRLIGIRRMGRLRLNRLKRFHESRENGIRVFRSWTFKFPGNEEWNSSRWTHSTLRMFDKYIRDSGKPDIILAHSAIWAGYAACLISFAYRIPYVITEHRSFFVYSTEDSRKILRPFYVPRLRQAYMNSRHLIIVSGSMRTGLLSLEPKLEGRIREIPNMVNGDFFSFPEKERSPAPFIFITAGRLVPAKGLDILIKAFAKLAGEAHSGILLRILGRGEQKNALEKLAETTGVRDRVIFTGRVSREDVKNEFRAANCFVLASRYEAFGVVLIEAMSTGLPVIATRSGGPESIVRPDSGYFVEPEDIEGLAETMKKMMKDYRGFDQDGIRKSVLQRYGREAIATEYITLLAESCRPTD